MGISNKVISDRITRERTFEIAQLRCDRKDAYAQLIITLDQILDDPVKFTGCIEVHCAGGNIINIKAKESTRV